MRALAAPATAPEPPQEEQPTTLAYAELVIFQTLHGVVLGTEANALFPPGDEPPGHVLPIAGGALGLGLSLVLARNGITPGHTLALNSGAFWGGWDALALFSALDPSADPRMSVAIAGQFSGVLLGQLAWSTFHPTAGDVSLMNSGALWGAVVAGLILGANVPNTDVSLTASLMLIVPNAGLLLGALLAHEFPMSRTRVLLIDLGGLLGTMVTLGLTTSAGMGPDHERAQFLSTTGAGTVAGLIVAAFLTRHLDEPDVPALRAAVTPTMKGPTTFGLAYDF